MSKKASIASTVMTAVAALMALMLLATPALAHHRDDHTQGPSERETGADQSNAGDDEDADDSKGSKPSSSEETTTEDNDDDGVSNTPDPEGDADNKHPSGKDKHAEAGGSGNQGKATSDHPDDDGRGPDRSNGGVDQPGGSGGVDQLDQDGNNGCGNDDDFEDDNEGLCGGPDRTKPTKTDNDNKPCDKDATMPGIQKCDEVLGEIITKPEVPTGIPTPEVLPELEEKPVTPDEEVLGERIERDEAAARPEAPQVLGLRLSPALNEPVAVAGAVLPFTGGELLVFLIAALGLIAAGALVLRFRSNQA